MAEFKGYLVKFGNYELPNSYLMMDSGQQATPNQIEDIKATRSLNTRELKRVVASGNISKFSLVFKPLTNVQLEALKDKMNRSGVLINGSERKYRVTYWNDGNLRYEEGDFYIPDITYERMVVYDDHILYNSFTMEFIGYKESRAVSG